MRDYHLAHRDADAAAAVRRVVLVQIFIATVDMIVAILRESERYAGIGDAYSALLRYQLAGLQGF